MSSKQLLAVLKNILKTKIYFYSLIIGLLLLTVLPILFEKSISNSFKEQIINNLAHDVKKISLHLSNLNYENKSKLQLDEYFKESHKEFDILNINIYNKNAKLVYSYTEDIKNNFKNKNILNNFLLKGESYGKLHLLENNTFIYSTFIPIFVNALFNSFYEIQYNASNEINALYSLSNKIFRIILFINIISALVLFFMIFIISKKNIDIKEHQKKLKVLANNDSLTGIYNRRYFNSISKNIMAIAKRDKEDISFAMIDIDDFKQINDTYGHYVGDLVIIALTKKIKMITRKSDIVARYGGEEFVILFPHTKLGGANIIANKICKEIQELSVYYEKKEIIFTISIGISQHKNDEKLKVCINNADKALYEAKRNGKNRVEIFIDNL